MNQTIKSFTLGIALTLFALYGMIMLDSVLHLKWNESVVLLMPLIGMSLYNKIMHADH